MKISGSNYLLFSPYYAGNETWDETAWGKYDRLVASLPPNERHILTSVETAVLIAEIVKNNNLTDGQGQQTAWLIRDFVLSHIPIEKMAQAVALSLRVDQPLAVKVSSVLKLRLFGSSPVEKPIPGADLPETGGNIIDLRNR